MGRGFSKSPPRAPIPGRPKEAHSQTQCDYFIKIWDRHGKKGGGGGGGGGVRNYFVQAEVIGTYGEVVTGKGTCECIKVSDRNFYLKPAW